MIDVVPNAGVIALGKQGENQAVRVTLPNIRAGSGSILLLHQRAADQQPYPVPVVEADGGIIWTVSSTDTAYPGRGQAELQWLGADGAVIKSVTYQTNTIRALTAPGAVPDEPLKPYTQAVAQSAQAAKDAAANATEAARSAEASAGQAGLSAATATEAARNAEAIVGQAGQSAQNAQAAALAAAQNAAAAETAEESAKQAQTRAEAAKTEAQTAKTTAEKAAQEAKTAQAGAIEAKDKAEAAQAQAEEAAQGVAADREQIGANTAGLEAARQDVAALTAETTALKVETAKTARSLDYLWKKSMGIIYDTEIVTGSGSIVTVPSGAMDYAAMRLVGGMSQRDADNNVLIDAPVDEVRVQGRNLLNPEWKSTSTTNIFYGLVTDGLPLKKGHEYTLTITNALNLKGLYFRLRKGGEVLVYTYYDTKLSYTPSEDVIAYVSCYCTPAVPADAELMLTVGSRGPYAPYREPVTYPIPKAIRDLCPDYGQGTVDAYNYIDFAAKTYHHAGSMSQDGTWTVLVTPEIIDLSAVWPDDDFGILRVEAGGTINLHYPALDNGYELAVPSETEIMVDVAKVVGTDE